jgi:hypothetical protein
MRTLRLGRGPENTVILALTFGCLIETSSEASLLSAGYTRQATGPRVRMCISGATGRELDATSSIYGEHAGGPDALDNC